ncbi:unnamed protein product [Meganyctiphanes norvegica]|uniref:DUF885 domain-containing protein n=1 Tax=Meganyctiphanes norvegica TaxID=48144 RepID=A0AAV2S502_MEGNR
MEGVHQDFERLVNWMILDAADDFNKLLSRYEALPAQIDQVMILMATGVDQGIVNHDIAMKSVDLTLEDMLVSDPRNSTLYKPFTTFPEGITQAEAEDFQLRAQQIIARNIIPAFERLKNYIKDSYVTRPNIAVTSLPDGEALYQQLLRFHTTTSLTPQEIHSIGLSEVSRIEDEMAEIVAEVGYDMTVPEFSAMIKNYPSFFYDNPEDLLEEFQNICFNEVPSQLESLFKNVPNSTLIIEGDDSPDGIGALYWGPTYDGSRPGVFYVNTYNYDAQPKYEMVTLSLHEGSPGHHLQKSYSVESSNTPFFRRVMDDLNYGMAPSRFPTNTAYTEGWGLYAEALGFDMALFNDPYDRYGHYSDEIFRACRLVVDTGIHALGWSRQQAVDYVFLHTVLALEEVENEIDRYITWPGQALGYKIGGLKIQELRHKAELALGTNFDIKGFHNIVLDASGPLDIVEDEVDAWIQKY